MRKIELLVCHPGDVFATADSGGRLVLWTVGEDGQPMTQEDAGPGLLPPIDGDTPLEKIAEVMGPGSELSVRAYNILKRNGVHTLVEVVRFVREQGDALSELRGMNDETRQEIPDLAERLAKRVVPSWSDALNAGR